MCANSELTPWDLAEQNILFHPKKEVNTENSTREREKWNKSFVMLLPGS